MATDLSRDDMRRLARLGAMRRLEEIRAEEAAIRASFPELFRARSRPLKGADAFPTSAGAASGRKSYRMSATARRAVSERMKKYWAERRKAKR